VANASSLGRDYDAQLRRAENLSTNHPASKEILAFYSKIVSFQKSLLTQIVTSSPCERGTREFAPLRHSLDLTLLLPHFRPFLALIKDHAPQLLAVAARELSTLPSDDWMDLLTSYWHSGALPTSEMRPDPASAAPNPVPPASSPASGHREAHAANFSFLGPLAQFFPRAFLQPYAALLASQSQVPPTTSTPNTCRLCGALPVLGILRPEGDGAKRSLLCGFCSTEWNYRRLLCPHCNESDETKLPVFIADQFPHIRTEACETCRTYLRTIDLTKDGHAIPPVDDLAALPLALWALEHHYSRLNPNLLST